MIAARIGDHATRPFFRCKLGNFVVRTPQLECANRLLVLGFEKEPATIVLALLVLVDVGFDEPRTYSHALKPRLRIKDVGKSDQ